MKKEKFIQKFIIAIVLVVLCGLIMFIFDCVVINIISVISLVALIILLIIGILFLKQSKKYDNSFETSRLNNKLLEKIKKGNGDTSRIVFINNLKFYLYIIYSISVFIFSILSGGGLFVKVIRDDIYAIIPLLLIIYIIASFEYSFRPIKGGVYFGFTLCEKKYPVLYSILYEIKEKYNVVDEIILYIEMNRSLKTSYYENKYHISIGLYLIQILNKDELKSLLYHEISHIINNDVYDIAKRDYLIKAIYSKYPSKMNFFFFGYLYFQGVYLLLNRNLKEKFFITGKEKESKADEIIKEVKLEKEFISGIIKLTYLEMFFEEIGHKFSVKIPNIPFEKYYRTAISEFLKKIPDKIDLYNYMIKNEIVLIEEQRLSTRERMENMGIDNYGVDFQNRYYDEEALKIIEEFDNEEESYYKQYEESFTGKYLEAFKIIKKYDQNENPSINDKFIYAYSLNIVAEIDKAYKCFQEILEVLPNEPQINYWIGIIKLRYYYDKTGIENMYKAAESRVSFLRDISYVEIFCLRMGLDEEYKKYEDFVEENKLFLSKEYSNFTNIDKKTKLKPHKLSDKVCNRIINYVKKINISNEMFIVSKDITKKYKGHLICLAVDENLDYEERSEILYQINGFLFPRYKREIIVAKFIDNPLIYNKLKKVTNPIILN